MNFAELEKKLGGKKTPLAICMPEDLDTLEAAAEAAEIGLIEPVLVGRSDHLTPLFKQCALAARWRLVPVSDEAAAAVETVRLVRDGEAKALMKGTIATPTLLKAVLNNDTGIKDSPVLSHVLIFEWQGRFRFLTDGGLIPHPTLAEKEAIINNAVKCARRLGCDKPRVAVLSAVEKVNAKIPSTLDAAVLAKMGERGQIKNCVVDGPLALDNAISLESAHHKGLFNDVVGEAEVLVAPDIDTGNILGKTLIYFGHLPVGGLVIGAKAPIVLLSRADTKEIRLNSIRLALSA